METDSYGTNTSESINSNSEEKPIVNDILDNIEPKIELNDSNKNTEIKVDDANEDITAVKVEPSTEVKKVVKNMHKTESSNGLSSMNSLVGKRKKITNFSMATMNGGSSRKVIKSSKITNCNADYKKNMPVKRNFGFQPYEYQECITRCEIFYDRIKSKFQKLGCVIDSYQDVLDLKLNEMCLKPNPTNMMKKKHKRFNIRRKKMPLKNFINLPKDQIKGGGGVVGRKEQSGIFTCAVCGVERFYKFVHQMQRYGIYSCQPCRMFLHNVERLVPTLNTDEQWDANSFFCQSSTPGKCSITTSFASSRVNRWSKNVNYAASRCKACWLLLCLKKYDMPMNLKLNLARLLPNVKTDDLSTLPLPVDSPLLIHQDEYNSLRKKADPVRKKSGLRDPRPCNFRSRYINDDFIGEIKKPVNVKKRSLPSKSRANNIRLSTNSKQFIPQKVLVLRIIPRIKKL